MLPKKLVISFLIIAFLGSLFLIIGLQAGFNLNHLYLNKETIANIAKNLHSSIFNLEHVKTLYGQRAFNLWVLSILGASLWFVNIAIFISCIDAVIENYLENKKNLRKEQEEDNK